MAARFRDLHNVPHKLQGFLRKMNAALWIAILEHPWQAGHRTADRHIAVGTPDNVLRLLAEAALLRTAVALIPDSGTPPDPPRPLKGIGGCGQLPPVDEHTHRRTGLACFPRLVQPLCRPAGPGALVLGIAVKGRWRVLPHTGILSGGGLVFLGLCPASGSIRGIGDDSIEGVGGEPAQHLQRVTLNDLPFLVIVHVCGPPCFCFLREYCRITPSLHTR